MMNLFPVGSKSDLHRVAQSEAFSGLKVQHSDGRKVGLVAAVVADNAAPGRLYLEIEYHSDRDGLGTNYLVPLEAIISVGDDCLCIDAREHFKTIADKPPLQLALV